VTGLGFGGGIGVGIWLILANPAPPPGNPGIQVSVSDSNPRQGEILVLRFRAAGVTRAAGTKREKNFFFFSPPERAGEWLALVPFDLQDPPGDYRLNLALVSAPGGEERKEITVNLALGRFGLRELRLPRGQVNPPASKRARIKAERVLLGEVFGKVSPAIRITGTFLLPIPAFSGVAFGEERILNHRRRSRHGGADCAAREGTTVVASNAGTVVLARELYYEGNTVIIDHGLGIYTVYLHFKASAVSEGQEVKRGEVIGWVGHTGRGTGPHLHFAAKILGERVDPNQLLNLSFD